MYRIFKEWCTPWFTLHGALLQLTHCGLGNFKEILNEYFSSQLQWRLRYLLWNFPQLRMSLDLTDDKSTLVQVIVWCRQATSHYLSQMLTQISLTICRVPGHLLFSYYFLFSPLFHATSYFFLFFSSNLLLTPLFWGMQKKKKKCTSKNMHLPHNMCILIISCAYK